MALVQLSPDSPVMMGRYTVDEEDVEAEPVSLSSRMFPRRILPSSVEHRVETDLCESFDYFDSSSGQKIKRSALWLVTLFAAVVIGLVKGGVFWMSSLLWDARIENMSTVAEDYGGSVFQAMGVYVAYAVTSGIVAAVLTLTVSIAGGGGGIADIKMYLNGNILQGFLGKRALFVRIFGVSLVTSCGVMAGPEGPMAHVGTIIAVLVARLCFTQKLTDRQIYDFATVGSGLGIASAFNAPLAGTLFALEEAASFWHPDLVSRTFSGALVTALVGQYTSAGFVCENSTFCVSVSGEFAFTQDAYLASYFSPWEMPLFILLGALIGVISVGFTIMMMQLLKFRRKFVSLFFSKIADAMLIFALTAIFFSLLTLAVPCVVSSSALPESGPTIASSLCEPGSVNPIALILLERRNYAVQSLYSSTDTDLFSVSALVLCAIAVFVTAAVTAGVALPAGLFVPMVLCGATIGRLFGNWVSLIPDVNVYPGVYALVGSSAFLGGVSRMTVWIALVMIESSDNLNLTIPVMIGIVSAKFVADILQPAGLYEQLILARRVKFLPNEEYSGDPNLVVKSVMSAPAVCFFQIEQVELVRAILALCSHSTFPVIDSEEHVIGIARRAELLAQTGDKEFGGKTTVPIAFIPISLNAQFPASKGYYIFSQLGVKVLAVVDDANRILGLVTRETFMHKKNKNQSFFR